MSKMAFDRSSDSTGEAAETLYRPKATDVESARILLTRKLRLFIFTL
ncbi:hypothetical protein [Nostoc sp. FACHB-888]|nr:hypothetical protein [Nostoc sp. FACHB-888]